MMVTAIVLMNVDRLQIKDVAQKMLDMSQVTEVFSVAGRYDLIAMVRVKSTEEVADTITEKIGSMTGSKNIPLPGFRVSSYRKYFPIASVG